MKSYLPPPETDVEVERKTVPTSTLFPVARIVGADVGDDDHQHHGHHGDDPLHGVQLQRVLAAVQHLSEVTMFLELAVKNGCS